MDERLVNQGDEEFEDEKVVDLDEPTNVQDEL